MASTVKCSSCGWSWNKSDSSKKDMYVCHQCGKDNIMKHGGWLDAYDDVPQAQNGIEGTMGGLTDQGFNYNGAWGGTMQMGGNLPGAVGFTYARTGAPSEGKYAKKTLPSAEEGMEILPDPEDPDRKYKLSAVVQSAKEILNPILRSKNPAVYDKWEADRVAALRKNAVKEYDASNPLSIYLSPEEVKTELSKQRKGYYEDYIGALKGISEYDLGKESYVGQKESNQPIEGLNYGSRFATAPVNLGRDQKGVESFRYSYIPKTEEYKKENFQNGGKMMSFYQHGLDFTPRNISRNGGWLSKYEDIPQAQIGISASESTSLPRNIDPRMRAALEEDMKRVEFEQRMAKQPSLKPASKPIDNEATKRKNKAYAVSKGLKYDEQTGAVSAPISPQVERTFERASENIIEPMIAMSPMGEIGMIRDVANLSKPFISGTANKLGVGAAKALFTAQKHLPAGIVKDNILGAAYGVRDISKGRPFFETFPITGKQKRSLEAAQDKAFNEGLDFVKDWNYSNQGLDANGMPILKIRPEVEARIGSIYPDLYSSPTNINEISKGNPIFSAKNLLVNSRTIPLLRNKSLSDEAKNYIFKNRGRIGGVNMETTNESITLRNYGPYYNPPEDIKDVAAHELGHSMQKLGSVHGDDWGQQIAKYDYPNYKYQIPNTATPFGKQMGEAMVEPVKGEYTWEASPLEPHSELMVARMKAYDFYKNTDSEKAIQALQNPDDDLADWLIENGNLNRFFKPTTSQEAKRKIIKGLPAAIPAIGIGAAATVDKKKKGGKVKKDDNGYWNPDNWGKPVEIGSNEITMDGVYEPLIGVSDEGDVQMMYPGKDYKFKGRKVTEYPVAQNGKNVKTLPTINIKTPTIYVTDPKDPQLRAYQDSLNLYNFGKKQWDLDMQKEFNRDLANWKRMQESEGVFTSERKSKMKKPSITDYSTYDQAARKSKPINIAKTKIRNIKMDDGTNDPNIFFFPNDKHDYGHSLKDFPVYAKNVKNSIKPSSYTANADGVQELYYKKPVKRVEYKKPEPVQEQPAKKVEQPKPVERKQNVYEGSSVYSPGAGSGMPSALIGFINKSGDTTYIKPEDYERFAVPSYGKAYIESKTVKKQKNGGWLDKY